MAHAVVDLDDLNSPHALAVLAVPPGATVLDVGCGPGVVARAMAARGCQVWGLEIDARKAALARAHCVDVVQADLESVSLLSVFGGRRFDAILCLDVLEHLRAPEPVLAELTTLLAPGGSILISVPNVTHGALRLELLRGRFAYRRSGLLDRGHLRFFDGDALHALVRQAGLRVETMLRVIKGLDQTEFEIELGSIPAAVRDQLEHDPDALTYQFFVIARPVRGGQPESNGLSLSERLRMRVEEVTAELEKGAAYARHLEAELKAKDEELRSRTSYAEQVARLAIELEQARSRVTEQAALVEQHGAELEQARALAEKQSLWIEQVTAELAKAGAYAAGLESALKMAKEDLSHAVSEVSHLADVQSALERTGAAARALEQELAARIAELETRREEANRLARALDQAATDRSQLEEAMAASVAQARALDAAANGLRRDLEMSQARGIELEQTVTALRRLTEDGAEYGRHLEQELQRRVRDVAIRDDELIVARVHVENTGRAIADRDSHVAQLETYIRHLESELQARAGDLAGRDTALEALRSHIDATERTLVDLRAALEGQQAIAAYLSRVIQLPRHRLATAWGDAFIRRVPWLHRRLRPLAARVARRWGSEPNPH